MMDLKKIHIPDNYNYIGCFLTLDCNFNCFYCINKFNKKYHTKTITVSGRKWVKGLNRLIMNSDLPVTLQGGEPSLHPDFIWIINNLDISINIDILTNLSFDVDNFIVSVDPNRLNRNAPYPNIRISYHPGNIDIDTLIEKTLKMQKAGFSVGIYGIEYPAFSIKNKETKRKCLQSGVLFKTKKFLGFYNGKLYGDYLYPEGINSSSTKKCLCRISDLIIGPDLSVYKCHHDLYNGFSPVGNLLDPKFEVNYIFRKCNYFGQCNPCDLKIKTNRFQVYGYTSAEIKNIHG